MKFKVCIDVDDIEKAVQFYGQGLGLTVVKHEADWAQVTLDDHTFWIMKTPAGKQGEISRDYRRHWTPIHLDFAVDNIEDAIKRAVNAGGKMEGRPKTSLANLSDPAGNGVDLVQRASK